MFTYSPVSKTSVHVSIRFTPSEPHRPGLEESEGIFKARNFRLASCISSPIRIPRNSKGMGCNITKRNAGALRPDIRPEASGITGTCARASSDTPIIVKEIKYLIVHQRACDVLQRDLQGLVWNRAIVCMKQATAQTTRTREAM